MKRRISHGQAMRSIFGRSRVTQTVRPCRSRGGSLAAGTRQLRLGPGLELRRPEPRRTRRLLDPGGRTAELAAALAHGDGPADQRWRPVRGRPSAAPSPESGAGRRRNPPRYADRRSPAPTASSVSRLNFDGDDMNDDMVRPREMGRDASACRLGGDRFSSSCRGMFTGSTASLSTRWRFALGPSALSTGATIVVKRFSQIWIMLLTQCCIAI